jgi:nitroimidazol reductase NimA-like FMN-containing flavoprotein (pyridoxamine 5'-phosphate oxidase superfamily)
LLITDIPLEDCFALVQRVKVGRLACILADQPYIVPLRFAVEEGELYCLSTLGRKIVAMRENPRVCIAFDEIAGIRDWISVLVFGHFEELLDDSARQHAHRMLQNGGNWWEPAYAEALIAGERRMLEHLYFRIHIEKMTGRRAEAG